MDNVIIAVDFDGTITKKNIYPNIGEIRDECVDVLARLAGLGCIFVLWTCRTGKELQEARETCQFFNLPIKYFNENVPYIEEMWHKDTELPKNKSTVRKVFAHEYLDDANVGGFYGWENFETYILDKYFS